MNKNFKLSILLCSLAVTSACGGKKFATVNAIDKASVVEDHMSAEDEIADAPQDPSQEAKSPQISNPRTDSTTDGGSQTTNQPRNQTQDRERETSNPNVNDPKYRVVGNDTLLDVVRGCRGRQPLANVTTAKAVILRVEHKGVTKCQMNDANLRNTLINGDALILTNCNLETMPNDAVIKLYDETGAVIGTAHEGGVEKSGQSGAYAGHTIGELKNKVAFEVLIRDGRNPSSRQDNRCDIYNGSPLVVDMRARADLRHMISLSAPIDGVDFDILGENSNPYAHAKKRISWFNDPQVMPIVLPDSKKVVGIDQMFGDNTKGPDGKFAANGFAALAKHDANNDTYITKEDAVFSKLRLWSDKNLDGVAQASELFTLSQYSITVIDLNYDPDYYRRDKHGNEFMFKSVVKRERLGKEELRPVFDIWFVIDERIQ